MSMISWRTIIIVVALVVLYWSRNREDRRRLQHSKETNDILLDDRRWLGIMQAVVKKQQKEHTTKYGKVLVSNVKELTVVDDTESPPFQYIGGFIPSKDLPSGKWIHDVLNRTMLPSGRIVTELQNKTIRCNNLKFRFVFQSLWKRHIGPTDVKASIQMFLNITSSSSNDQIVLISPPHANSIPYAINHAPYGAELDDNIKPKVPNNLLEWEVRLAHANYEAPKEWKAVIQQMKLRRWWQTNVQVWFSQIKSIPLGPNPKSIDALKKVRRLLFQNNNIQKKRLLLMNFRPTVLRKFPTRGYIYDQLLIEEDYLWFASVSPKGTNFNILNQDAIKVNTISDYFFILSNFHFVISPAGHGIDCFRTWEAIALGVIPIVHSYGPMDQLYENLPVLIVNDWRDITFDLLVFTLHNFQNRSFDLDKIYERGIIDNILQDCDCSYQERLDYLQQFKFPLR